MNRQFFPVLAVLGLMTLWVSPGQAQIPVPPQTRAIVEGNNEFAWDLYQHLSTKKGNLFYSPYSISNALAMTYAGARGQTAEEMAKTLNFPGKQETFHPAFGKLVRILNAKNIKRQYQLNIANSLWGQKGYDFSEEFRKLSETHYVAGLKEVDYINATEEARQRINEWVENETQKKINDLLPKGVLNRNTRLVLANAIYFKAAWQKPFGKYATKPQDFFVNPNEKIQVPMMNKREFLAYTEGDRFQSVAIPYKRGELEMVIFLPKTKDSLAALEKSLTADNIQKWWAKSRRTYVDLKLPRFEFTTEFQLKNVLAKMGMPQAFSNTANFSGLSSRNDLKITEVVHKAFVDVNEKGTEAAAATGVIVGVKSALPENPISFHADHPFVFVIRENNTGSILFVGRVVNPQP